MTFGSADSVVDAELALRAAAGDEPAFGQLMRRHKTSLHNMLRRMTGDSEEAYDLLQDTFVSAWLSIERYDQARAFQAWIRQIALNKGRDWARRRAVRRLLSVVIPSASEAIELVVDPAASPETVAADVQALRRVERLIAALPIVLKEPLVLTVFDGLSQRETADLLGISEKAVETRVRRARLSLAESLVKLGKSAG